MVLLIISILSVVVVPRIEIVRYRMDGSARGLVAALVAAQRMAVQQQHDVVVRFDTANRRLLVHADLDNDGIREPGESVRHVPLEEGVEFGRGTAPAYGSDEAVVSFESGVDGVPMLRFIRNGSASEEGWVYLTSVRAERSVELAGDARMVRVSRATGRVTWYAYDPPDWKQEF